MDIICAPRRAGKTSELIRKSSKNWTYIICRDKQRAHFIDKLATEMNLRIPFPITMAELPISNNSYIKKVIIDDIEDILETLVGRHVQYCTTSSSIVNLENIIKEDKKW